MACRHEKIDFWDNVYGFDFSAIKRLAMQEPLVDVVDQEQVVTDPCQLSTFNISDMTKADAAFTVSHSIVQAQYESVTAIHVEHRHSLSPAFSVSTRQKFV